jgi:hypothetical protein
MSNAKNDKISTSETASSWSMFWLKSAIGEVQDFDDFIKVSGPTRAQYSKPCWQLLNEKSCTWAAKSCEWDAEQAQELLLCLGESAPLVDPGTMGAAYESLMHILLDKGAKISAGHFEAQCVRGQWQALTILLNASDDRQDRGGLWWLIEKLVGSDEAIDGLETKLMFEHAKVGGRVSDFVSQELQAILFQAKKLAKLGQSVNRIGHNGKSARQCMQNFMQSNGGGAGKNLARTQCEPLWAWILSESEREVLAAELIGGQRLKASTHRL